MTAIVTLSDTGALDVSRAGGKAANCARLKHAGFAVPDGIVVCADATDAEIASLPSHTWFDAMAPDVTCAVRSSGIDEDSAGQSFAGIHETRLNVARCDVVAAVTACRASAMSEQALAYRRATHVPGDAVQIGVLVQRMVQSTVAGVAFTVNPITRSNDHLVINASWGLGEALVSGLVEPDEFGVRKADAVLLWQRLGDKGDPQRASAPSLTPAQIHELSRILIDIEQHYGAAQDVEWCHDGSGFWIVQSRPVTTIGAQAGEIEWTRANLAEVLPDLTSPQALDALERMLNQGERLHMGKLLGPEERFGPMLKSFYGRLYFNVTQLRHVCAMTATAPAMVLKSFGHSAALQPSDNVPDRASIGERLAALPSMLRLIGRDLRVAGVMRQHSVRTGQSLSQFTSVDPRTLPDQDLWAVVERWFDEAPEYIKTVLLLGGVLVHELPLRRMCARIGYPFEHVAYPQLAAGERSVSAQQAFDLRALAEAARNDPVVRAALAVSTIDWPALRPQMAGTLFLAALDRFLEQYGHRGRYESDWALPRYREDATPLLMAIKGHLVEGVTPELVNAAQLERQARDAWAAFEERLSWWQKRLLLPIAKREFRKVKQFYVWRERVRSDLVRVVAELRTWHLVLADRFVERGWIGGRDDYFFLLFGEIESVVRGRTQGQGLRAIAQGRIEERARWSRLEMPLLMHESELPALIRMADVTGESGDGADLTGQPVSNGRVEAEVVVIRDPGDFGRMKRGAILVARATDPSWTPLFTLASGVIVEVGGVLSHASTIAREYGLPALANVRSATRLLKTGERVVLDATMGIVRRVPS